MGTAQKWALSGNQVPTSPNTRPQPLLSTPVEKHSSTVPVCKPLITLLPSLLFGKRLNHSMKLSKCPVSLPLGGYQKQLTLCHSRTQWNVWIMKQGGHKENLLHERCPQTPSQTAAPPQISGLRYSQCKHRQQRCKGKCIFGWISKTHTSWKADVIFFWYCQEYFSSRVGCTINIENITLGSGWGRPMLKIYSLVKYNKMREGGKYM